MRTQSKEENINFYKNFKTDYRKGSICCFYIRGLCEYMYNPEFCQFAHGIDDLNILNFKQILTKLDILHKEKSLHIGSNLQKSKYLRTFNYNWLYEFQLKKTSLSYSIDDVNKFGSVRNDIRKFLLIEEYKKLVEIIFREAIYNEKEYIEKSKFEDIYCVGLGIKFNVDDYEYTYIGKVNVEDTFEDSQENSLVNENSKKKKRVEKKNHFKKVLILKKTPSIEMLDGYYIDIIQKGIEVYLEGLYISNKKEPLQISQVNLSPKLIKSILVRNENESMPSLLFYLKIKQINENEYFNHLIKNNIFISNLNKTLTKYILDYNKDSTIHSLFQVTDANLTFKNNLQKAISEKRFLFEETSFFLENEKSNINKSQKINFLLKQLIFQFNSIVFVNNNYKSYGLNIDNIFQTDSSKNNDNIRIGCDIYSTYSLLFKNCMLFDKLKRRNIENIYDNQSFDCSNLLNIHTLIDEFILFDEIENVKILIVDSFSTMAQFFISSFSFKLIAVDVELDMTGISIIQVYDYYSSICYIIDLFSIRKFKNNEEIIKNQLINTLFQSITSFINEKESCSLFSFCVFVIKQIFESKEITKILHDCRNDVQMMSKEYHITPISIIDISCLYIFQKQIEILMSLIENPCLINDESLNVTTHLTKGIILPSLNKILKNINTQKINPLKEEIGNRFDNYDDEYFNKRPFHKEWMLYCVYDVVFLVDAYLNISLVIKRLLKERYQVDSQINEGFMIIYYLLSYTHYSSYACVESEE